MKALAGGALVAAFALVGEVLRPKWFAGLFSATPSVAVASLIVTVADKGDHDALLAAIGMMFGAAGFFAFALVDRPLLVHSTPSRAVAGLGNRWQVYRCRNFAMCHSATSPSGSALAQRSRQSPLW